MEIVEQTCTSERPIKRLCAVILAVLTTIPSTGHANAAPISRCLMFEPALKALGLPVTEFSRIMYRESRCQPKAIGWNYHAGMSYRDCKVQKSSLYKGCRAVRSYDSGLLQVNSSWVTVTAETCKARRGDMTVLLVPACNLAVAAVIYRSSGIGNWR